MIQDQSFVNSDLILWGRDKGNDSENLCSNVDSFVNIILAV